MRSRRRIRGRLLPKPKAPAAPPLDRHLRVEIRVVDINGCEAFYSHTYAPFGPAFQPLVLMTGGTHHGINGVRAQVRITDPLGPSV